MSQQLGPNLNAEGEMAMARRIVDLDVRPILLAKGEPFQVIMETVQTVGERDVFQLHATFDPVPLERVLGKQGFQHVVRQEADDHFIVQFSREQTPLPYWRIDNRGLEPPQPMIRTLTLLDQDPAFAAGERGLEIWNERVPAFLLPELEERGYQYDVLEEEPGTVVVRIHR